MRYCSFTVLHIPDSDKITMAPVLEVKCEEKGVIRKVQSKPTRRIKEHSIQINRTKQVQKR